MATAATNIVSHKLVLLGDTSVGKSCLVVRFCRGDFYDYQEATIGGMSDSEPVRCLSSFLFNGYSLFNLC